MNDEKSFSIQIEYKEAGGCSRVYESMKWGAPDDPDLAWSLGGTLFAVLRAVDDKGYKFALDVLIEALDAAHGYGGPDPAIAGKLLEFLELAHELSEQRTDDLEKERNE